MKIIGIVAVAKNGIIGRSDGLSLWHLSSDLISFKEITTGYPIIMGRKTYDTIGHPLPDRTNIVLTKYTRNNVNGVIRSDSIKKALSIAQSENSKIFVIGGAEIFRQMLPIFTDLYITEVEVEPDGDLFFNYAPEDWQEYESNKTKADSHNDYDFITRKLSRKK